MHGQATADRPGTLILGLGNLLLSDEGIGVHAVGALVEQVQLPPDVEVLDGGTSGMDLLDQIAARVHLIVVDAVKTGRPPGSVVRLTGEEVPAFFQSRISPHQLGLSDVLAVLRLMDCAPERVTVIGVEPVCLDLGLALSPAVAACLPEVLALIRAELLQRQ
ncbi:MAG: HyaD/HybD family hydrogenase maturation endopeptidase [Rhodospirillales bacterium]|nr:HyaD/HybD family hydrogenase maturation endopeptidase [Rhodospirillales bacterium]